MAIVRNILVRVGADISEMQKQLQQAQKYMKNAKKQLTSIGSTLTKAVTLPILGVGVAGIKTASDLQEVQNVVDTAFGNSAQKVNEWANTTLENFGLTELQAKKYAGTMRAMLDSMGLTGEAADDMSMRLAELAGDFASFYNLDHEEAWEKIRSGISGETEPLKQLGINMSVANLEAFALSQGINKAWKEMTAAEQATLRYNYLMSVSKNAQGDFAKTQDSFANQLRIVKGIFMDTAAQLTQSFLPALESMLSKVRNALEFFRAMPPEQLKTIVNFALLAAAAGPVIFIIGKVIGLLGALAGWLKGINAAILAVQAGTKGFGAILTAVFGPGGIILLVIAAIAGLVALIIHLWKTNEGFRNAIISVWQAILNFLQPVFETIKTIALTIWGELQQFWAENSAAVMELFSSTWEFIMAILTVVWNNISTVAGIVFGALQKFWETFGATIISIFDTAWSTVKNIFSGVVDVLSGIMKVLTGILTGEWEKAWEGAKQIFEGIWNAIKSALKGAINFIIDGINLLISGLNSIKFSIPVWVPVIGGKSFGINIPKIPKLAEGGIVTGPTLAMIGEAGPEAVIPLERINMGSNVNGSMTLIVQMDGRELTRAMLPYMPGELAKVGVRS